MSFEMSSDPAIRKYGLDTFKKTWFSERGNAAEDFVWSMQVSKVLHQEKSKYHDILVFESKRFGKCLALDNVLQCTENDEFVNHEMITFLLLNSHPDPNKILIVGGGDGGVAREAAKHPSVKSIVVCEIDEGVIDVSKRFLPFVAKGLDSSKVIFSIGNGVQYLKECKEEFDVIITDSLDTIGPAVDLFKKPYFESLKTALKPGGVLASHVGSFWFDIHKTRQFLDMCRSLFPVVDYASILVPSYPAGQIGILLCGKSPNAYFRDPFHKFTSPILKDLKLRYYTPDVHRAAFALPLKIMEELKVKKEVNLY